MISKVKLLSCPFCGEEMKVNLGVAGFYISAKDDHIYNCPLNRLSTIDYKREEQAIQAWNNRTSSLSIEKLMEIIESNFDIDCDQSLTAATAIHKVLKNGVV